MKKIGKEVCFLAVNDREPRKGEGSFVRLRNGDVMYVYTDYREGRADHSSASLSACISSDGGESFGAPYTLIEKDESAENIMSVSLFRMNDGNIGMVYLRKETDGDGGITCMPVFVSSSDEGKSWGSPVLCTERIGYYCVINDGVIVQRSGRILIPMAHHGARFVPSRGFTDKRGGSVRFACSDDNGKSWQDLSGEIFSPYKDTVGLAEPGVYEREDGELWMWCRTAYGFQYQSFSKDGGISWTPAEPNLFFTSPDSPMRVKRVGGYTVAVFNPVPHNFFSHTREDFGAPKRTPLACAVCRDDGRSFLLAGEHSIRRELSDLEGTLHLIEDDRGESYCYPAIIDVDDGFLVGYYHSGGTGHCLTSDKITKVYYSELVE